MNILCFGDSNTFCISPVDGKRLAECERWPGMLAELLGSDHLVIEAGQPNRTLVNNPPFDGDKSGIKYLKPYLEVHTVDVVIIQLGTNDLKARFDLTPEQISQGLTQLLIDIKDFYQSVNPAPKIIILSPARVYEVGNYKNIYSGAAKKLKYLGALFSDVVSKFDCKLVDCYPRISPCVKEGIHFDAIAHKRLTNQIFNIIKQLK